jgi:hypothetical protein
MLLFTSLILTALGQSPDAAGSPPVDPTAIGPQVGQPIPPFEAADQDGRPRSFASLAGPNGLVLVFYRSADW